jgi:hypothetical protein
MRWTWQNLSEHPDGGHGPGWRHGRAWLYARDAQVAHAEWSFRWAYLGVEVTRAGQWSDRDDVLLSLHLGCLSLYLGMSANWLRRRRPEGDGRVYGLTYAFEHDLLHWRWSANEFGNGRRGWRDRSWFLRDVLLGRSKYDTQVYQAEDVLIPMPEASYPARVELHRATWKRPRWPWPQVVYRAHVDIPGGVPAPSKWGGDDGCYGLTRPAKSVSEAIGAVVEVVERDRRRHGGPNWRPKQRSDVA